MAAGSWRAAFVLLLVCGVAGGVGVKRGELGISSPVRGQEVRAGSDLIVKYEFDAGESGGSCSVLLLLNGRVESTLASCSSSLALSHRLLKLGENTLELVLQGDATATSPEHTVPFTVVAPRSWGELDAQVANSVGSCQAKSVERVETTFPPEEGDEGGCPFTGGCLHEVDGSCLLFDDPSPDTTRHIPRILHWVWVGGGGEIPDKFHDFMDTWLNTHPEWQFIVWTDEKINWPLRNQALMHQADTYAELSDLVRLEVVERFGGVYIDTDFEALQAIDELVAPYEFFVGVEKDLATVVSGRDGEDTEAWVCPSIFGAAPHNPVVRALIDGLPHQVAENLGKDPNHKTGPYYWSNIYDSARACALADKDACQIGDVRDGDVRLEASYTLHHHIAAGRAKVFPRSIFYPYGWWEQERAGNKFEGAYAVHHWQKNWGGGWKQEL